MHPKWDPGGPPKRLLYFVMFQHTFCSLGPFLARHGTHKNQTPQKNSQQIILKVFNSIDDLNYKQRNIHNTGIQINVNGLNPCR